jgi:hypothetical protein
LSKIKESFSFSLASRPATASSLSTTVVPNRSTSGNRPTKSDATSRPARENASGTTVR